MLLPTITTVMVRAADLPEAAVIKIDGRWTHLYEAHTELSAPDDDRISKILRDDLDGRYAVLRVAADPDIDVVFAREDDDKEARDHAVLRGRGKHNGLLVPKDKVSGEYDDRLLVVKIHDLFEMQVVTYQNIATTYVDPASGNPDVSGEPDAHDEADEVAQQ